MFEQSFLLPDPDKKRWTFAASLLMEVSAVSVLLLIPLIYSERLGIGFIQSSVLRSPTPPLPPPVQQLLRDSQPRRTTATPVFNPLAAPTRRPDRLIVSLVDVAEPSICTNCVPGGVPEGGVAGSILGSLGTVAPPPPPTPTAKPAEVKKPAEPPPPGPLRVSTAVQEAKIIRRVIPTYPPLAKQARVQGTVKLLGVISTGGRIEKLQVISGHPLLVPVAVEAVRQWTYRPTLLNGQPVEVMAPIDVNFILSN